MVFLGDARLASYLFTVIHNDNGLDDVDAMIAKRALSHHTQVALNADDWEEQEKYGFNWQVISKIEEPIVKSGQTDPLFSLEAAPFCSAQTDPLYSVQTDPLIMMA